jgi:hypothetical protein
MSNYKNMMSQSRDSSRHIYAFSYILSFVHGMHPIPMAYFNYIQIKSIRNKRGILISIYFLPAAKHFRTVYLCVTLLQNIQLLSDQLFMDIPVESIRLF